MIQWKKITALLGAVLLASSVMAPWAAADDRTKVGKIHLSFYSPDVRVGNNGGEVQVEASGSNTNRYFIDSVDILNEDADWTSSSAPIVEVVLGVTDEEKYYFGSRSSSGFELTLDERIEDRFDDIEFVSASREDDDATLILKVRLIFDEDRYGNLPAEPSAPQWDASAFGRASWGDVTNAKYFQFFGEAFGNTCNHIAYKCSCQSVQGF